jgi:hypothetical protein
MIRPSPSNLLASTIAAAVLLGAAPALAADYCLVLDGTTTYVGKNFKLPKKGKCVVWSGFCSSCGTPNQQSGTACTASDGSTMKLQILTSFNTSSGLVFIEYFSLALPAQTGTGRQLALQSPDSVGAGPWTVTGANCPNTVPIP